MLKSTYTYWAYLTLSEIPAIIVLIFFAGVFISSPLFLIVVIGILFLLLSWIVFVEISKKIITVLIYDDNIKITPFLSLVKSTTIDLSEVDGFKSTGTVPELNFEVLYLIKDNKKIIRVSAFYCANYYEIKTFISSRLKNLGEESFNIFY